MGLQHEAKRGVRKPLLKDSDRVAVASNGGMTALMVAAQFGALTTLQRLLSEEGDVDDVDSRGWTALHCAAYEGHAKVCVELLKHGANAEAADHDGRTPMQIALEQDPKSAVVMAQYLERQIM